MKKSSLLLSILFLLLPILNLSILAGTQQSERQLRNIKAFAKVYGYVRFFHPSDEASKINWDKFAIYGAEKVKDIKNDEELKDALKQLFLPIAPTAQIYSSNEKPKDITEYFPKDTTGLKVVTWQHLGVYTGTISSLYSSGRTNRINKLISKSNMKSNRGYLGQSIDASNYIGKELKIKGLIKTNITDYDYNYSGNGNYCMFSIMAVNTKKNFVVAKEYKIINSNSWQEYELNCKVPLDANSISILCQLNGEGKIWVDDFQLFYKDGNNEWTAIDIPNNSFEDENKYGQPVYWQWSFGNDYTIRVSSDSAIKGKKCVTIENNSRIITDKLFDKYPKIGEGFSKKLDDSLFCIIPLALYSDSNGTIGKYRNDLVDSLANGLSRIDIYKIKADNENLRLADIIISWNIFQHFYPYFEEVKVDWDKVLTQSLYDALNDKTSDEFYNTLRKMVAKLQDGHGYVNYNPEQKIGSIPISVDWIENQLVITGSQDSLFHKGDIIEKLDGVIGKDTLLNEEQYVSGSPQLRRYRALNEVCEGSLGSIGKFQIIRNGKELSLESARTAKKGNLFFNNVNEFEFPSFKKLENEIYYINLHSVTNKQINDSLLVLSKAKGIIFDERVGGKPDGSTDLFQPHSIIQYLIDTTVYSAWMNVPQIIYPDRQGVTYDEEHWTITPKEPRIKSKIVFINVPSVVSYGESYMGIFEYYKLAEFVGEATAGTNGNVNFINLPGGFNIMWTGMKLLKQDGSQHHLIGIQPTYPVQRTIKAVKEGRDEYLEKSIEVIKSKI